jgi:hypothetical protein
MSVGYGGARSTRLAAIAGLAAIMALAPAPACRAEGPYSTRSSVDWKARELRVEIELDLAAAGLKMPEGRLSAERMMDKDLASLAKEAVLGLQADSHRSVADASMEGDFDPEALVALASRARLESSSFTKDMRKFVGVYAIGLEEVSALFLSGAQPSPIRAPLDSRPTRDYTGLVIYAKGELPVHGEGIAGRAAPCLFPRVYDEDMNLILDRTIVVPEALARSGGSGGVLGYATALGVEAGARVGGDPLRVMAVELFGDRRTDYVISREDALRVLASPSGRELLRQGKVVVVLDLK